MLVILLGTLLGVLVALYAQKMISTKRTMNANTIVSTLFFLCAYIPFMGILGTAFGALNAYALGLMFKRDIHTVEELRLADLHHVLSGSMPFILTGNTKDIHNIVYHYCFIKSQGLIRCVPLHHNPPRELIRFGQGTESVVYMHTWGRSPTMQLYTFDIEPVLRVEETWLQSSTLEIGILT